MWGTGGRDELTRNHAVPASCIAVVIGMVGMSYAAVPLYDAFCRATGYGGTPSRADAAPGATGNRIITVQFDTNVDPRLPWTFVPEQRAVSVKVGEDKLVYFHAVNRSDKPLSAMRPSMSRPTMRRAISTRSNASASPSSGWTPANTRNAGVLFRLPHEFKKITRTIRSLKSLYPTPFIPRPIRRRERRPLPFRRKVLGADPSKGEHHGSRRSPSRLSSGRPQPLAGRRFDRRLHDADRRRVLDEQGLYRLLRPAGERHSPGSSSSALRWCSTPWPAGGAT